MARAITRPIFGGGPGFFKELAQAKQRFLEAVDMATGLQQPDHSDSEEAAARAEQYRRECEAELRDMGRDILASLGLRAIDLWIEEDVVKV